MRVGVGRVDSAPNNSRVYSPVEAKFLPALGKLRIGSPSTDGIVAVGVEKRQLDEESKKEPEKPLTKLARLTSAPEQMSDLLLKDLPDDIIDEVMEQLAKTDCKSVPNLCAVNKRFGKLCKEANIVFWVLLLKNNRWVHMYFFNVMYHNRFEIDALSLKDMFAVCCRIDASPWDEKSSPDVDWIRIYEAATSFLQVENHNFNILTDIEMQEILGDGGKPFVNFKDFAAFVDAIVSPHVPDTTKTILLNIGSNTIEENNLVSLYLLRMHHQERLVDWPCVYAPGGLTPSLYRRGQIAGGYSILRRRPVQQDMNLLMELKRETKVIENDYFKGANLTGLICVLPPNVEVIKEGAFEGANLSLEMFPRKLESIQKNAFKESALICDSLPQTLKHIGESAFENCGQVTFKNLPESIVTIGKRAFYYCLLVRFANVQESTEIGDKAFAGCPALSIEFLQRLVDYRKGNAIEDRQLSRLEDEWRRLSAS